MRKKRKQFKSAKKKLQTWFGMKLIETEYTFDNNKVLFYLRQMDELTLENL